MILNWIGVVAALATFFGVWIGHVTVRKVEYRAPDPIEYHVALFLAEQFHYAVSFRLARPRFADRA